jgi:hypothetical protein
VSSAKIPNFLWRHFATPQTARTIDGSSGKRTVFVIPGHSGRIWKSKVLLKKPLPSRRAGEKEQGNSAPKKMWVPFPLFLSVSLLFSRPQDFPP